MLYLRKLRKRGYVAVRGRAWDVNKRSRAPRGCEWQGKLKNGNYRAYSLVSGFERYVQFSTVKSTWRRSSLRDATRQKSTRHTSPATFGENSAYFCITPFPFPSPFSPSRDCDAAVLYDKAAPVVAQRCETQRENDARFHPFIRSSRPAPRRSCRFLR